MTDEVLIDFVCASIVGLLAWFFGGLDGYLNILIALSIIDYLSGTLLAWKTKTISSRTGFEGIFRKCLMFTFVGIGNLLDKYLTVVLLGGGSAFRTSICFFYIGNEGISIIENADQLGIPIPKFLRSHFLGLKEKHNDDSEQSKVQLEKESNKPKHTKKAA